MTNALIDALEKITAGIDHRSESLYQQLAKIYTGQSKGKENYLEELHAIHKILRAINNGRP